MIKFGPSGNSEAFYDAGFTKSEDSAVWVKNLNLSAFEYSFGRGVKMTDARALEIGGAFKTAGVEISVHAPYFINLSNPDDEKAENSFRYITDSALKTRLLGGNRIIFHPASQGKEERRVAVDRATDRLKTLRDIVYEKGLDDMFYCPETMGKLGQIGTIEEITEFCKIDKIYIPTVDFGHINARENGSLKTEKDYLDRLNYMIDGLGMEKMKHFHIHFSKIEYTKKGEVRHLTFADEIYGPEFYPLALALKTLKLEPIVICESAGTQDIDAKTMKDIYENA